MQAQELNPGARIATATALSSLVEKVGQKPWHLKMEVTVFDDKGKNPNTGTVEIWSNEPDQRAVYLFGDASETVLYHDKERYSLASGSVVPYQAFDAVQEVLHPGPSTSDLKSSEPELRKQKFGKVELDCIMLSHPMKVHRREDVPLGMFPTYCLDPASDRIRTSFDFGTRSVTIQRFGKFLNHEVPMQLDISNGNAVIASAKIISIATYTPEPDEFIPTPEMKLIHVAYVAGGVISGKRIFSPHPVYPSSESSKRESTAVVLHVTIGYDGHVRSLRPINEVEPDFALAAIAAVRQWTYEPYRLNGVLVEVDTTITLNFNRN